MALPVPDGRLGLLDDVHDPAAELRIEVQVVDVRPDQQQKHINLRTPSIPGNGRLLAISPTTIN